MPTPPIPPRRRPAAPDPSGWASDKEIKTANKEAKAAINKRLAEVNAKLRASPSDAALLDQKQKLTDLKGNMPTNPVDLQKALVEAGAADSAHVPRGVQTATHKDAKAAAELKQLESGTKLQEAQVKELENKEIHDKVKDANDTKNAETQAKSAETQEKKRGDELETSRIKDGIDIGTLAEKTTVDAKQLSQKQTEMNNQVAMKENELRTQKDMKISEIRAQKEARNDQNWQQEKANIVKARETQKNRENAAGNALAKAGSTGGIGQNGDMLEKKKGPIDSRTGQETDRRTADRKQQADKARSEREQTIAQLAQIRGDASSRQV